MPKAEGKAKPKRSGYASLFWVFRTVLVVLLLLILVNRMFGFAERLAFWPSRQAFQTPAIYEDVWIETTDGVKLHAWFMPAKNVPKGTKAPAILHAHGNAGNIASHQSFSNFLTDAGMSVLIFDYRCYGRSDEAGPVNRSTCAIDTKAALQALLAREDVDPNRVGVLGVSIGGPFALLATAEEPRVRAIATLSTFSSWQAIANDATPILGPLLIRSGDDPTDTAAALQDRPYLIMHGNDDQIINPKHANLIYDAAVAASIQTILKTYPGDHNSLVQLNAQARQDLIAFFQETLSSP
jgi:dipeptidyl aminopeptidase/acylaminoacyl peptidase